MEFEWLQISYQWLDNEKQWIFSGIGLTIIGGILLFFRWILGLMLPQQVFATIDELHTFQRLVDQRFKVLNSWIQLIYSRQSPAYERDQTVGFHEDAAPTAFFDLEEHIALEPPEPEPPKPSVNDQVGIPRIENVWSEGLSSMARLKAHARIIDGKAAKINAARKLLLIAGAVCLIVSILLLMIAIL